MRFDCYRQTNSKNCVILVLELIRIALGKVQMLTATLDECRLRDELAIRGKGGVVIIGPHRPLRLRGTAFEFLGEGGGLVIGL